MSESIGPYRVVRRLGAGGMGEVFLAEDPRLGRQVALKRPSDQWLEDPDAAVRLQREARAAAGLNHPNIAAVYDVLEANGRPHIVMEYVEGETLARALQGGPLPLARVLDIGVQLAEALVDAHAHGVVHRDLKPGNVMLTSSGRIKVLDFGLARTARPGTPEDGTLTGAGRILGTPGYMAPEQMLGHRADERSDIYSAGVVLFELLTGQRPFVAPDAMARALAALREADAPRANSVNLAVPEAVADVAARAMARDPADRFQRATDFRDALMRAKASVSELPTMALADPDRWATRSARRWWWSVITASAVVLVVGSAAGWWWMHGRPARAMTPDTPVVAVLPFDVISNDPGNAYLGVGFADSLVTELARMHDVTVVRRDEVRVASGGTRDAAGVARVARAVGANLVVDASLQVNGPQLQVNVTLMRADGSNAWSVGSYPYKGTLAQLFDLQRQVADGVIAVVSLGAATRPAAEKPGTSDLLALTNYWQGRALLDRADVPGNRQRALDALNAAVARDPRFALAHAALSEAALLEYKESKDAQWVDTALRESDQAVEQDSSLADVYVSRAAVYKDMGKTDAAIAALQHAIAVQPTNDNAQEVLGDVLFAVGRREEAIAHFQKAIGLRPRLARHYDRLGVAYLRLSLFDDAVPPLRTATELQPDNALGFHKLGTAYQFKEDYPNALDNYARALKIKPLGQTFNNMGVIEFEEKHYADAARSFEEAVKLDPKQAALRRGLGDAYQRVGLPAKARVEYLQGVDLLGADLKVNPKDGPKVGLLALCLAKIGQIVEAGRRADDAVALSPKDGEVLYRRAVVLAIAERQVDALAALDLALAAGYSAKRAAKDEDLERIRDLPAFRTMLQKHQK